MSQRSICDRRRVLLVSSSRSSNRSVVAPTRWRGRVVCSSARDMSESGPGGVCRVARLSPSRHVACAAPRRFESSQSGPHTRMESVRQHAGADLDSGIRTARQLASRRLRFAAAAAAADRSPLAS